MNSIKNYVSCDRPTENPLRIGEARRILNKVFKEILSQSGFALRKEQIDLAVHMLNEISKHGVTLAEAEVGTGKTLAYLVAAVIAKRGRLNDFWNTKLYPEMPYAEMSKMPIVIATSSIALQKALITEYIPQLSVILIKHGVIDTPLTAVIRKGREHYALISSGLSTERVDAASTITAFGLIAAIFSRTC